VKLTQRVQLDGLQTDVCVEPVRSVVNVAVLRSEARGGGDWLMGGAGRIDPPCGALIGGGSRGGAGAAHLSSSDKTPAARGRSAARSGLTASSGFGLGDRELAPRYRRQSSDQQHLRVRCPYSFGRLCTRSTICVIQCGPGVLSGIRPMLDSRPLSHQLCNKVQPLTMAAWPISSISAFPS